MNDGFIINANVVTLDGIFHGMSIAFEQGKITQVRPADQIWPEPDDTVLDAEGGYVVPGFIDLHIHGMHEYLVDDGPEALSNLCSVLPKYGVTGFLPTVAPRKPGDDAAFLAKLARVESHGATIHGFHLEGPFLTITGALPKEALGSADADRVQKLIDAADIHPAIFSISPDFEGIDELIPIMRRRGPVFITHTAASAAQTRSAIDAGATHATHFFDVFPSPTESEPGVRPCGAIEAILADDRTTVDFILDGEHVDPLAVQLALKVKGSGGVCLITDANVGAGLEPGTYDFCGREVEFKYRGGPARLKDSGSLAGSGLTMDRAVRNAVEILDVELPQAVRMASANPARVLGLADHKGQVARGFDADLVLLDNNMNVRATWVYGKRVYTRES